MGVKYRKGIFFIIYIKNKSDVKNIILKRKLHWKGYEFPKGGVEKSESLKKTVLRELTEETGQNPSKIKRFNVSGKYRYNKKLKDRKEFVGQTFECLYAIEIKKEKIKIDEKEHFSYDWLNFKKAHSLLKWPNQKRCLKLVNAWLEKE